MNQFYYRLLFISVLPIVGIFCLLFFRTESITAPDIVRIGTFMRNNTWQTNFWPQIPYKKWDEVEYSFFLSSDIPREVHISLETLEKSLDITGIEIDGKTIDKNILNTLSLYNSSLLKITGKAKHPSENTGETTNISPLIKIETTKTIEVPIVKTESPIEPVIWEPRNLHFWTHSFNSNIANLLSITGENLSNIAFVNIGGVGLKPITTSGSLLVAIDRDTFATGDYFILLQLTTGKIITMNEKIHFQHADSKINIANITPYTIENGTDHMLVIQGNGFDKILSIQMNNNLILKNAEFTIINNRVAGVRIPKGLPPGNYYFNIMDTNSIYELKNMQFTITGK